MPRMLWQWLLCTAALTAAVASLAAVRGDVGWWRPLCWGIGVSLATLLASKLSLLGLPVRFNAAHRVLLEACIRLALPLGLLFAIAIAKRELLNETFLLYFLPFQLVTIAVGAGDSIRRIDRTG